MIKEQIILITPQKIIRYKYLYCKGQGLTEGVKLTFLQERLHDRVAIGGHAAKVPWLILVVDCLVASHSNPPKAGD